MTGQGGSPVTLPTTTIKLIKRSLYTTLQVGSIATDFLADSGAEISVISKSHPAIRSTCSFKPIKLQPVMADGKPLDVEGIVSLPVLVGEVNLLVDFYVAKTDMSPILGLDVMRQFQCVNLDFVNHTVNFGPQRVVDDVRKETSNPRCCRVVLPSDLVVPARSEVVIQGKLAFDQHQKLEDFAGENCLLETPSPLSGGLSVARVLGHVKDGLFPVKLCNPFLSEVRVTSQADLGTVTVLGDSPVISVLGEDDDVTDVMSPGSGNKCKKSELVENLVQEAKVSNETKRELRKFLNRYSEAFSWNGELGRYNGQPFKIDTGNSRPIRQMPRRVPFHLKKAVDEQIDEMLSKGVIRPSTSEWASPVCLVRKPDGSLRFCVDYRKLNEVSKHDAYPLPNINDCLASLGNSCYFSTMDMASGYWQCSMDPESGEKAAITTHRGLFQPEVLPFGVKGGVAHFSRVMAALFSSLQWKTLLTYLDDLMVFSNSVEEHFHRLSLVFDRLIEAGLKLKPSKCHLFQKSVKFLGHMVSASGISPIEDKIQAIVQFPVPKDIDGLKRFLGMSGYYRDFIAGYADLVKPLTDLTRKDRIFEWSTSCQKVFSTVKDKLMSAPILAFPDYECKFILTTDASNVGLGAVLSQYQHGRERVISFASRPLTKAEVNYSTTEKECLAVVWSTEYFRHYLLGAEEFIVRSDHDPLRYLRSVPCPRGRLARWIGLLEQYSYKMCYVPGKDIPHADALSRSFKVSEISLPVDVSSPELIEKQQKDKVISRVLELRSVSKKWWKGETKEVQQLLSVSGDFVWINGVLCVSRQKDSTELTQIVVPRSLVSTLLARAHDDSGHFGVERTLSRVREKYFWGSIFKDVTNWVQSCTFCQNRNRPSVMPKAPLQFMPIPSAPWQCIAIDFVGPLVETSKGNTCILVVTDRLSKYTINIALPDQKAITTAAALFLEVFCVHSFPESILSDQGRNFESQLIKAICEMTGIDKIRTSGYHPQTNGQSERYNQTMATMLSKYIDSDTQNDWDKHLPVVAFHYNTSIHSVTGFRPFDLHFGKAPRIRLDMFSTTPMELKAKTASEWLCELQQTVKKLTKQSGEKIKDAQEKQKLHYGQDIQYKPYGKGDMVLCREHAYKKGLKPKLIRDKWSGPWKIQKVLGPVNYRLVMGNKRLVVHHNRLKPFISRANHLTDAGVSESAATGRKETINVPPVEHPEEQDQYLIYEEDARMQEAEDAANEEPVPAAELAQGAVPDVPPEPIMGHRGEKWCDVNPDNVVEGSRRRR